MENDNDIVPVSIFDIYPYPDVHQGVGAAQGFLVLLKGNVDERVVPITIGQFEGQALAMAIRKIAMPRPLPHDLLRQILEHMGATVERLIIHTLEEEVFHACLEIDAPGDVFPLDCRPSDGMILATQLGVPLFLSMKVIEKVGRVIEVAESEGVGQDCAVDEDKAVPVASTGDDPEDVVDGEVSDLDKLKAHLDWLIAQEAYEEAAEVRDQISKME
tara:strand:- start:1529 stop:2176 length:648 start_codon:yes stop_codon:yes gene_type:complete